MGQSGQKAPPVQPMAPCLVFYKVWIQDISFSPVGFSEPMANTANHQLSSPQSEQLSVRSYSKFNILADVARPPLDLEIFFLAFSSIEPDIESVCTKESPALTLFYIVISVSLNKGLIYIYYY